MTRRFQFSLRTLLGLSAIVCLILGGLSLVARYGQYVAAEYDEDHPKRARIVGRIIHPFGPREIPFHFRAINVSAPKRGDWWSSTHGGSLNRSWLCVYNVDLEMYLPTDDYSLELAEHEIGGQYADPADNTVIHGRVLAKHD